MTDLVKVVISVSGEVELLGLGFGEVLMGC